MNESKTTNKVVEVLLSIWNGLDFSFEKDSDIVKSNVRYQDVETTVTKKCGEKSVVKVSKKKLD